MEIEIMGHKYQITDIEAIIASFLKPKEDTIKVYLRESVVGRPGYCFAVSLPMLKYGGDEFLAKVAVKAEDVLSELKQAVRFAIAELNEPEKEYLRRIPGRQKELDALVDEIKSKIGLSE